MHQSENIVRYIFRFFSKQSNSFFKKSALYSRPSLGRSWHPKTFGGRRDSKVKYLEKLQKDLNNNLPHLGYRLNSRGSKANCQHAPVHWLREITKAKLSQAKFGQVWES